MILEPIHNTSIFLNCIFLCISKPYFLVVLYSYIKPTFRQPGSRWALEQAKFNLIHNYLLVGVTEELGDFIGMLEVMLPQFFRGAMDLYVNGKLQFHSNFLHLFLN